jgi:hypothetical protein
MLAGYEESGLSRQEYCRRAGIPVTTLDYYRQRAARKAAATRLVQVKVKMPPVESPGVFTVVLRNGRRIESGWKFSDADLARLIGVAEAV